MRYNQTIRVQSLINQQVIADKCYVAERFFARLRGLIGTRDFVPGEGMLFPRCNNIHMWFMSIPIDVVFLKRGDQGQTLSVTSAHAGVRPWRVLPLFDVRASDTLELPAGTIKRCNIHAGDQICLS